MIVKSNNSGLGNEVAAIGVGVGGSIAAAGGIVSGTIIGLPAGAVLAAVGGLVALGSQIAGALHIGEGCGPTCVQATQIVNQAEPTFKLNLDAYKAGTIDQATAISNYQQMKVALQQACSGIPGTAGENCYSDRFSNPCKWKDSNGQCWNWEIGYYQPLLVSYGNSASSVSNSSNVISSLDTLPSGLLIGIGLLLVGLFMGDKK